MNALVHEVTRGQRQFFSSGSVERAELPLRCVLVIELSEWILPDKSEAESRWFNASSLLGELVRERQFRLEVTSDLKIRTELHPMDRELLAPLVKKLIESLLEAQDDQGDANGQKGA